MRINRLFELVYLLMDKKNMTAQELAEHFEVSKRTVFRDIEVLTAAGIPIYCSIGRGGGISLIDNYVLNKTVLSLEEQQQILLSLQSLSTSLAGDTNDLLRRLESLFNKNDNDWIEVNISTWGDNSIVQKKFNILKDAVLKHKVITFAYSGSTGETKKRQVNPLKLYFQANAWYLKAFCLDKNDYRLFKLNRLNNIKVLDQTFDATIYQASKDLFSPFSSTNLIELELHFLPMVAYRVYDEFEHYQIKQNPDDSLTVKVKLPYDNWLYDYILSFGPLVKVIQPQVIKEEVIKLLDKTRANYL